LVLADGWRFSSERAAQKRQDSQGSQPHFGSFMRLSGG
jgi:hypothetical protein